MRLIAGNAKRFGKDLGFANAASSFANALLKESDSWDWLSAEHSWLRDLPNELDPIARFPLSNNSWLLIPVSAASQTSVYRCYQPWWKVIKGQLSPVSLVDATRLLCRAHQSLNNGREAPVLPARVQDSLDQIEQLIERRPADQVFSILSNFIDSDQALLGGHPSHPCPRAKGGFCKQDSLAYSPEHQGRFALHWLAVDPSVVISASRGKELGTRLWQLVESDEALGPSFKDKFDGQLPWPVHPWQANKVLQEASVQNLMERGLVKDLGHQGSLWTATSSLRSIYRSNSPYMLKYSLSVQLTNSVRHLLPHEVERGLQVVDVWDSPLGQAFSQRYQSFSVIREPAWFALSDAEGKPMINTITVLRDNLFTAGSDQQVFMLGSLCQLPPLGQLTQLAQIIIAKAQLDGTGTGIAARDWYQRFLTVALEPMLMAQADEGLLFGAHQQNTLLRLDSFNPAHFYYRDCQGTGFSALGVARHRAVLDEFSDDRNQLEETMAIHLFSYYLIVNTLFAVIAAISQDGLLAETELLTTTRNFLKQLRNREPRDTSCLDFLLDNEHLYVKGNLLCSLRNINENTMTNPLDLYLPLDNPLRVDLADQQASYSTAKTETA